jgi:SlyX protein
VADFDKLASDLVEVQTQLAFQEDTVSVLNEAITGQQQEIILLRRQLELLKQRLEERGNSADDAPGPSVDEKPPHY